MLTILANGTLLDDPVEQRGANDEPCATCTMCVPGDDGKQVLVSVVSVKPAVVAALLALRRGTACTVAGRASLTSWQMGGVERTGLSVVADRVI